MIDLPEAQDIVEAAAPNDYYRTHYRPWEDRYMEHVCAACEDASGSRALDIGPGYGTMPVWLRDRGWEVTAMDMCEMGTFMTPEFCADLEVAYENHNIEVARLSDTFDLIVMTQVLTHLKWNPTGALDNVRDMLQSDGCAVISVTNRDTYPYNMDKVHHTHWRDVPERGSRDEPLPFVTVCVYDRAGFVELLTEVFGDNFAIKQPDGSVSMIATAWR